MSTPARFLKNIFLFTRRYFPYIVIFLVLGLFFAAVFFKENLATYINSHSPLATSKQESASNLSDEFLETQANWPPVERTTNAIDVLGEDFAKYDQDFLKQRFGITRMGKASYTVTCRFSGISESTIEVDCGSFKYSARFEPDTGFFLENLNSRCITENAADCGSNSISKNQLQEGDLIQLVIVELKSTEDPVLSFVVKYI